MIKIKFENIIDELGLNPAQVLVLGFGFLIIVGATLLNLPLASVNGKSIGFIDSLFTASSAVCVTGLVVVNTAEHWTLFGKIIILLLIQFGGFGFMTMATMVALLLRKKITLKTRLMMQEALNHFSLSGLVKLTRYIIIITLMVEGIGAVLLSSKFIPLYGIKKGIWYSVFHSISAFCNAGFDITGSSMVNFADSFIINITLSLLIIIGGLGFTVILDIIHTRSLKKLTLHTKLVLMLSGILLALGFLFVLILEYNNPNTLGDLSFNGKILASVFQSVVPRTAGFNSVDMASLTNGSIFIIMLLMFIGGSPSSTAGGVKTTTIGVIVLSIISVVKGETEVQIFKKRIANETIFRALAVAGIGFVIVTLVVLILSITESAQSFITIVFEAISAFATVGLSRGLTPELSTVGRLVITVTMFIGRLGPLTMAFAFANKRDKKKAKIRYSEGKIMVG